MVITGLKPSELDATTVIALRTKLGIVDVTYAQLIALIQGGTLSRHLSR
jgi:hypothetical protein